MAKHGKTPKQANGVKSDMILICQIMNLIKEVHQPEYLRFTRE